MSKKVEKALSPEEATALSNIKSILDEILAQNAGTTQPTEPVQDAAPVDDNMDQKGQQCPMMKTAVNKDITTTQSDGTTANDKTEAKIDDNLTDLSAENVQEIAKAVVKMLKAEKPVQVQKSENSDYTNVLTGIVQIQKSQNEKIDDLTTAFENILTGMGISKQIQIAKSQETKQAPVLADNSAAYAAIQKMLNIQPEQTVYKSNAEQVRQNLSDPNVLLSIVGKA